MGERLRRPALAHLMGPPVARAILFLGLIHLLLVLGGLPGWSCPLLQALGLPCPGCGLSRALAAMVRGQWALMVRLHAFAPLFALAMAMIGLAALLPPRQAQALARMVEKIEIRTGLTAVLLLALLAYWIVRLAWGKAAFLDIMAP